MKHGEYEKFFNIVPREEVDLDEMRNPLSLNVVRGVNTTPDLNIKVNDLSHGFKQFYNGGGAGITFKIKVIIDKDETFNDVPVTTILDTYARNMTPLGIRTNAIDVSDGVYLITENPSRTQELDRKTEWELTFQTYNPVNVFKYKNDNTGVLNALNKAKKNNNKNNKSSTKSVKNSQLRKCDYKVLKYSKKKKVVKCVKYMQQVLYNKKYLTKKQVDGWFGKETTKAVKKFQKAYNKKNKIKVTNSKKGVTGIKVNQGTLVTKTNSNINTNALKNVKLNTKQTKGNKSSTAKVKSIVLPENGKVDKQTYNALCNS